MQYIKYYGYEGKILSDKSIICISTGMLKKFKTIKSFKKYICIYNYKYIGNKKSFELYNNTDLRNDYIMQFKEELKKLKIEY